jgi:cytochrome b561
VALHWATVLVLAIGLALILTRDVVEGRALRQGLLDAHRSCGLLLLLLCVLRLALRWRLGRLPALAAMGWLQRTVAASTHALLYGLLAGVPLLGWALSGALDQPVSLFGIALPGWVAADEDMADALHGWHSAMAWTLLALVAAHAGAALWHHVVRKDAVLSAMSPRLRRSPTAAPPSSLNT